MNDQLESPETYYMRMIRRAKEHMQSTDQHSSESYIKCAYNDECLETIRYMAKFIRVLLFVMFIIVIVMFVYAKKYYTARGVVLASGKLEI